MSHTSHPQNKQRESRRITAGVFAVLALFQWFGPLYAGAGLQTKFGLVTIENLEIGQTYNTREIASLPMVIKNTGDEKVTVKVEPLMPDAKSPSLVNNGYEPIPDLSWVKFSRDEMEIEAGASEATDILVTIPDDEKLLGKKYQVDLITRSLTTRFMAVALRSNLRITISPRRLTAEEVEQRKKVSQFEKIDFDLVPNKAQLDNVPLGREVDVEKEFKNAALKISNPNDTDFLYHLDIVTLGEVEMGIPPGYESFPLEFVGLKEKEVRVAENSIRKLKMTLRIPNEEKYKGKKYVFAIRGKVAGTPVELYQVSRYVVMTQK